MKFRSRFVFSLWISNHSSSICWKGILPPLNYSCILSKIGWGASLVAQWLRVRLPVQGTRVQSLVREDPTCHGATKPLHHGYWACALELASRNYWSLRTRTAEARAPGAGARPQEKPPQWEARAPKRRVDPAVCNWRTPVHSNEDPMQPKINK